MAKEQEVVRSPREHSHLMALSNHLLNVQGKIDKLKEEAKIKFISGCRKMKWVDVVNKTLENGMPKEIHVNSFQHDVFFAMFFRFSDLKIIDNKHLLNGELFFSWETTFPDCLEPKDLSHVLSL
jgi:hypothetical protein